MSIAEPLDIDVDDTVVDDPSGLVRSVGRSPEPVVVPPATGFDPILLFLVLGSVNLVCILVTAWILTSG